MTYEAVREAVAQILKHHLCYPSDEPRIIDHILAKLAEMGVIQQWRDISSAPRDGTFVLACMESGHRKIVQFSGVWRGNAYDDKPWSPTHWQPLPPAPEAET